jgi:hypothetical protein
LVTTSILESDGRSGQNGGIVCGKVQKIMGVARYSQAHKVLYFPSSPKQEFV